MNDEYDADKNRISFLLLGRKRLTSMMLTLKEFSLCFWELNEC